MRKVISFLLKSLKISTDEVSFYFVNETAICKLHEDFFSDPTSTDCITLPMDPPAEKGQGDYHILGEAFVCPQTAIIYAKKHNIDPLEEVYRYVIHCLLHLIGYTDTSVKERARMKRKEGSCLKNLLTHIKSL